MGNTPPYVGVWGHQHVCQAFWCLSVHPLFSVCGCFLLDGILGCLMLHAVVLFFIVFIMSQVSTTMAMTTTPLTSDMSSISSVTLAPSLMGLPATLGQHDMILPPTLMSSPGGVIGLASVPQQQLPSSVPLQAYVNYAMGAPQVGFFFRVEPPTILYIIFWCLFWCLGGSLLLLSQLFPSHSIYMVGHTTLEAWQRVIHPSAIPTWWGGVFFSRFGSI